MSIVELYDIKCAKNWNRLYYDVKMMNQEGEEERKWLEERLISDLRTKDWNKMIQQLDTNPPLESHHDAQIKCRTMEGLWCYALIYFDINHGKVEDYIQDFPKVCFQGHRIKDFVMDILVVYNEHQPSKKVSWNEVSFDLYVCIYPLDANSHIIYIYIIFFLYSAILYELVRQVLEQRFFNVMILRDLGSISTIIGRERRIWMEDGFQKM